VAGRDPATAAPPASLTWRKPRQVKLHCLCISDAKAILVRRGFDFKALLLIQNFPIMPFPYTSLPL
jgi:hypothetical protein